MKAKRVLISLLLLATAVLILFPIVMTFFLSFYSPSEVTDIMESGNQYTDSVMKITIDWRMFSLEQYRAVLSAESSILQYYRNSILYTIIILLCQAAIIPTFAYALSRFTFPGRDLLSLLVILLLLLPFQVTMVPMVLVLRKMGLMDTIWAMILPAIASPFYIFLLRQHMVTIPDELFEAAQMDGAGTVRCYFRIALPMSKAILISFLVLSFADCWNMVEQPLVFLPNRSELNPLSVLFNQMARQTSGTEFAGAALYMLPAVIVYGVFQRKMMEGIQLTGIK